jgi:hypothetical protein
MPRNPLRAKHRSLDLLGCEHQGRQVETLFQDIAHARLAADRHALLHQGRDVAVDRALGGFELGRDGIRSHGFAGAPEHLNDLEQTIGTTHGKVSHLFRAGCWMLTPCWQQVASITVTTLKSRGVCPMIILYGLDLWTTISPLLTPRWQQGMANLKRLLRKKGVLH